MYQSPALSLPEYQYWYDAIRINDINTIRKELTTRDSYKKEKLVNGTFNFDGTLNKSNNVNIRRMTITVAWHLVVIKCGKEAIKLFLDNGVRTNVFNGYNDNVLHSMILTAAYQEDLEDSMIRKYHFLTENIEIDELHKLLKTQNKESFRPLEYTIHNALPGLFQGKIICLVFLLASQAVIHPLL